MRPPVGRTSTPNDKVAVRPPGSRAVTVTIALPRASATTRTVSSTAAALTTAGSEDAASYTSGSPSGSVKYSDGSTRTVSPAVSVRAEIGPAASGARFGTVTSNRSAAARPSGVTGRHRHRRRASGHRNHPHRAAGQFGGGHTRIRRTDFVGEDIPFRSAEVGRRIQRRRVPRGQLQIGRGADHGRGPGQRRFSAPVAARRRPSDGKDQERPEYGPSGHLAAPTAQG